MGGSARKDRSPNALVAQAPDRGFSPRAEAIYRLVKVERAGEQGMARCRKLSDNGMRLDLDLPLSLGEGLNIEFSPGTVLPARVVWTNGDQCGVAFDRSVDSGALLTDMAGEKPRSSVRPSRHTGDIPARLEIDGRTHMTTITDISQQAMKVTQTSEFHPGLHVRVILDNGDERAAVVQWTNENFAGLFLFDHFSVTELSDLRSATRRRVTA